MQLFVVYLFLTLFASLCVCHRHRYDIPEPFVEILRPRGFRISIPDEDGIQLFAFHGNVNKPMYGLDAGEFSRDILHKRGDSWTFEDKTRVLKAGDKLYYWLYVINNGIGHRYDDGYFEITDSTPFTQNSNKSSQPERVTDNRRNGGQHATIPASDAIIKDEMEKTCERVVLNITQTLLNLQLQVDLLKDTNNILREIAEKSPTSSRSLRIEGGIPPNEEPLSIADAVVRERLRLPINVAEARRNKDKSITFEVGTLTDKINVIRAAKDKLRNSKIILVY